jgi:glycosyltransferase involved in cell wall biosynthesis
VESFWVVVPAYNEAENLVEVVPLIVAELAKIADGRVIIVDDGSTDATPEVVTALQQAHPAVDYLRLGRNLGKAAALQRGFGQALDAGADVIAMMDADGQDDPAELARLVGKLDEGFDLVTGARVVRRDRFLKKYTSRLYNRTTSLIAGVPGRDFNSGFKVMRAKVARDALPMLYGELHRYLTVIASWTGHRVVEVPVEHHARRHGSSKYGLARFFRGFMDLMTVRFIMSYENRPSHLFGGIGLLSLLVGGGILIALTVSWFLGESLSDRPLLIAGILFVVVGVQLLVFGLLAELVVYGRNRELSRRP